jgi:hypothetical protein
MVPLHPGAWAHLVAALGGPSEGQWGAVAAEALGAFPRQGCVVRVQVCAGL